MKKIFRLMSFLLLTIILFSLCGCTMFSQLSTYLSHKGTQSGTFVLTEDNCPDFAVSGELQGVTEAVISAIAETDRTTAGENIIFHGDTEGAFEKLVTGDAEIAVAFYPDNEIKQFISSNGTDIEISTITTDKFVFLVNENNRTDSLTEDKLKRIFKGTISTLKGFGNSDKVIRAYGNDGDSLSMYETFIARKHKFAQDFFESYSADAIYDEGENSITFTTLLDFRYGSYKNSKMLNIDDLSPLGDNYPYNVNVCVAIRADAGQNSSERVLYNYLKSEQAAEIFGFRVAE